MQDFFSQASENIGNNRGGGLLSALRKQHDTLYRKKGNSSRSTGLGIKSKKIRGTSCGR